MARVYFWRDVVAGSELFAPYGQEISQLMAGEYKALSLERLRGFTQPPIYSIRVNDATRILFTTYDHKACLLDVVLNHDYDKSRFLKNPAVLAAFLSKLGAAERVSGAGGAGGASGGAGSGAGRVDKDSFVDITAEELPDLASGDSEASELMPLEYYQQRLIRFSAEQSSVLSASLPSIVYGPAGCGKSSAALSLFAQYVREHQGDAEAFPIVYVSRSKPLVETMQRIWQEMNPEGVAADAVVFKTYDALLTEQLGIEATCLVHEDDFYAWYDTTYAAITRHVAMAGAGSATSARLDAKLIWQELRIRSGYEDDKHYHSLGARQSSLEEADRYEVCKAYHAYQQHLEAKGLVSPSLFALIPPADKPKLVVVDEAQDLSYQQLRVLNRLANGALLYLLGEHQVLFDGKSRLNYLREMFHRNHQTPSVIALHGTYRCAERVSALANALIQLKYNVTKGASDGLESSKITVAHELLGAGEAVWLSRSDSAGIRGLAEEGLCADFAVVAAAEHVAEAKALFKTPLVFTPKEVKGLEFRTVVLFRPLDSAESEAVCSKVDAEHLAKPHASRGHRAKAGDGDETHLGYFNELITAVTRAQQKVVIVQDARHKIKAMHDYLTAHCAGASVASSAEVADDVLAWQERAKVLLLAGKEAQARAIVEEKLGGDWSGVQPPSTSLSMGGASGALSTPASAGAGSATETSGGSLVFERELATLAKLVTQLPTASKGELAKIKRGAEFKQLLAALAQDGSRGVETTFLYQLVATPTQASLLTFCVNNNALLQNIPDKMWYQTIAAGKDKSASLLALLAGRKEGCELLPALFKARLELARAVPVNTWGSLLPKLAKKNAGYPVLKELLTQSPKAIPSATWVRFFTEAERGLKLFYALLTDLPDKINEILLFRPKEPDIALSFIGRTMSLKEVLLVLRNLVDDITESARARVTPMDIAAERGHCDAIRAFHALGADVNKSTMNDETPAFIATDCGHVEVLRVLHELGADFNQAAVGGVTPAFIAAQNGDVGALRVLHALGADLNKSKVNGATPVHVAAQNGDIATLRVLRELGADLNKPQNEGATPAHNAAEHGHVAALKALHVLGADLDQRQKDGATPAFIAAQLGHVAVLRMLHKLGADLNKPMKNGATPVFIAVLRGDVETLRVLYELGADFNKAKIDGTTPADIAAQTGNVDVIRVLHELGASPSRATDAPPSADESRPEGAAGLTPFSMLSMFKPATHGKDRASATVATMEVRH